MCKLLVRRKLVLIANERLDFISQTEVGGALQSLACFLLAS